jgi:hypothetical protein
MAKRQVNPFDQLLDQFTQEIVKMVHMVPKMDAPPGAVKLKPAEVQENYDKMRDDPDAWGKIIQKHGFPAAVKYWHEMEGKNGKTKSSEETQPLA